MSTGESTVSLGKIGEQLAVSYLKKKNWEILALNWKPGKRLIGGFKGEVDIIANDPGKGDIVFVEVKSLRQPNFDDLIPENHFTKGKFLKLKKLSGIYLVENRLDKNFRIDLIAINFIGKNHELKHYEGVVL